MADGIVYLTVDFTAAPGTQTTATVERGASATGPWTLLDTVDLLSQMGSYYDTTAPLDVAIWYRWTGSPGGTQIVQGPFTEASTGTVLVKDPLRPWANLEFEFCPNASQALDAVCNPGAPFLVWAGLGNKTYRADANLFDVYNARVPADIYGVRKRLDGSMKLFSKSLAAKDSVETLFAGGGPLQLQLPAVYGFPDVIVQPGDLVEEYLAVDQRKPHRVWEAPFTAVDRPTGPQQGTVCANWCAVQSVWPTFADMTASGATWGEIAAGTATCPGGATSPVVPFRDTFTRVVAGGWGTADTGQVWTTTGGAGANYSVNGTRGVQSHGAAGVTMTSLAPWPTADVTVTCDWAIDAVPLTGGQFFPFVVARALSTADFYMARCQVAVGGAITLAVRKRIANAETQLAFLATGLVYVANAIYTMRFRVDGTNLMAKVWLTSGAEPAGWMVTASDPDLTLPANVGVRSTTTAGFTNPLPINFFFDNFQATV